MKEKPLPSETDSRRAVSSTGTRRIVTTVGVTVNRKFVKYRYKYVTIRIM